MKTENAIQKIKFSIFCRIFPGVKKITGEILAMYSEKGGLQMKKLCSIALIFVLTATLLVGCGGNNTEPTASIPDASSSTQPTVMPKPELPTPSGTDSTAPDENDMNRMMRPSARGLR